MFIKTGEYCLEGFPSSLLTQAALSPHSLIEWLQHSKKKYCELCNHTFTFHKKYKSSMPVGRLPSRFYLWRLLWRSLYWIRYALRALICVAAWLVFLPLVNIFTLRGLMWTADVLLWGMNSGPRPDGFTISEAFNTSTQNAVSATSASSASIRSSKTASSLVSTPRATSGSFLGPDMTALAGAFAASKPSGQHWVVTFWKETARQYGPFFHSIKQDCFEGQVLTCVIVVVFVGIFLLREWVMQHLPQAPEEVAQPQVQQQQEAAAAVPAPQPATEVQRAEVPQQAPLQDSSRHTAAPPRADEERPGASNSEGDRDVLQMIEDIMKRAEHAEKEDDLSSDYGDPGPSSAPAEQLLREGSVKVNGANEEAVQAEIAANSRPTGELGIDELRRRREAHFLAREEEQHNGQAQEGQNREIQSTNPAEEKSIAGRWEQLANPAEAQSVVPSASQSSTLQAQANAAEARNIPVTRFAAESHMARHIDDTSFDSSESEWEDLPEQQRENREAGGAHQRVPQNDVWRRIINIDGQQGIAMAEEVPLDRQAEVDDEDEELAEAGIDPWEDVEEARAFEDDMDGILEAVGLHGPFIGLLQNLALLTVLCSFAIFVVAAVPFVIGRLFGTGERVFWLAIIPVRMVRKVTDPLFDGVISALTSLLARILPARNSAVDASFISKLSTSLTGLRTAAQPASHTSKLLSMPEAASTQAKALGQTLWSGASAYLWNIHASINARLYGKALSDHVISILLGHCYWIMAISAYLGICKYFQITSLGWMQSLMQEELLIIKVGGFIGIELIAFPLGCGFLLDLSCLPLFPTSGVFDRIQSCLAAPVTFLFLHWVAGTLFMFLFAQFVSLTRDIARPGVLCWIRDPNDPTFQPVKEILERRSTTQLAKIGTSVFMYAVVLLCTVGVPCATIRVVSFVLTRSSTLPILPLRTSQVTSTAAIASDLVAILVLVPWVVKKAKPARLMRRGYSGWWKLVTAQFRLSSFLRGGRHKEEEGSETEGSHHGGYAAAAEDLDSVHVIGSRPNTGSFARVPADNNAIMTAPLIIRTDISGVPLDERGMQAIRVQHEAITKATGPKPKYTIVYIPPHFRLRLWAFIFALFVSMASLITCCILLPLLSGRLLSAALFGSEIHDGHCYFLGACFCLGIIAAGRGLYKVVKGSKRTDEDGNAVTIEYDSSPYARLANEFAQTAGRILFQRLLIPLLFGLAYQQCEWHVTGIQKV